MEAYEQPQQQQEYQSDFPIYNHPNSENTAELQLLLGSDIEELRVTLLGLEFNSETNKYEQVGEPLINFKGYNRMVSLIKAFITTRSATLSHIQEDYIRETVKELGNYLTIELHIHRKPWQVRNIGMIRIIVTNMVYQNLTRARNGFTAKNLTKQTSAVEKRLITQQPQTGGLLSRIFK